MASKRNPKSKQKRSMVKEKAVAYNTLQIVQRYKDEVYTAIKTQHLINEKELFTNQSG